MEVQVTNIDSDFNGFDVKVISGGQLSSHKGVNTPGASLSIRPPTKNDLEGIRFGVLEDIDWFAASFIRDKSDVDRVKEAIIEAEGDQPLISKIEHAEAITNIDEIIEASEGIMVARGDLGIEVPPWEVPLLQKHIISKCNEAGKPVIVATQMLESMVENPRPTRAEANVRKYVRRTALQHIAPTAVDREHRVYEHGEAPASSGPNRVVRWR